MAPANKDMTGFIQHTVNTKVTHVILKTLQMTKVSKTSAGNTVHWIHQNSYLNWGISGFSSSNQGPNIQSMAKPS